MDDPHGNTLPPTPARSAGFCPVLSSPRFLDIFVPEALEIPGKSFWPPAQAQAPRRRRGRAACCHLSVESSESAAQGLEATCGQPGTGIEGGVGGPGALVACVLFGGVAVSQRGCVAWARRGDGFPRYSPWLWVCQQLGAVPGPQTSLVPCERVKVQRSPRELLNLFQEREKETLRG